MEQYKVVKKIKKNGKTVARIGDLLTAKNNYNRLWGVKELVKGDKYICDLGSTLANENCKKV